MSELSAEYYASLRVLFAFYRAYKEEDREYSLDDVDNILTEVSVLRRTGVTNHLVDRLIDTAVIVEKLKTDTKDEGFVG